MKATVYFIFTSVNFAEDSEVGKTAATLGSARVSGFVLVTGGAGDGPRATVLLPDRGVPSYGRKTTARSGFGSSAPRRFAEDMRDAVLTDERESRTSGAGLVARTSVQ
jgi:hypothetical protein